MHTSVDHYTTVADFVQVESLREAHEHHRRRADELREKHPDITAVFDSILNELDVVSKELHKITSKPVELQANFSRFGYSGNIRTHHKSNDGHDDDADADYENEKEISSPRGDDMDLVDGALASGIQLRKKDVGTGAGAGNLCNRKSTTLKIYKKPVLRQYFHKGLLYRAQVAEEVASCELFVDLLYVGILAFNGDKATELPNGMGLLRFCVSRTMEGSV
jgi:hypothetical protein